MPAMIIYRPLGRDCDIEISVEGAEHYRLNFLDPAKYDGMGGGTRPDLYYLKLLDGTWINVFNADDPREHWKGMEINPIHILQYFMPHHSCRPINGLPKSLQKYSAYLDLDRFVQWQIEQGKDPWLGLEKPPTNERAIQALRLKAVTDASPPYIIFDGKPYPASEVAVHFVAALIQANGGRVSFAEWLKEHPKFEGNFVHRVLDSLPAEIQNFIERPGKGKSPRLKIEHQKPAL